MAHKRTLASLIAERNQLEILIRRRAIRPSGTIIQRLRKLNEMIEQKEMARLAAEHGDE